MTQISTVEDIWRIGLCNGCGSCVGVCPHDALQMSKDDKEGVFFPVFRSLGNCTKCTLCLEVCPGLHPDLDKLNLLVFGRIPNDPLIGNYIDFYIGHSTDRKIRWNAASGGLATSLLILALEEKIIDAVVVTRMRVDNPLEPEAFIARTKEEVLSACKSKYCPVPVNVAIRDILSEDGRFAVVGLPCHIKGFRRAEMLNQRLREKMSLHIGLLCGHTVSFQGTEFLLDRIGIEVRDIIGIDYRGRGWPGVMAIRLKNGGEKILPYNWYWDYFFEPFFFTPMTCLMCNDATNELADISLGDAWLPEIMYKDTIGESIAITRTQKGEEILKRGVKRGKIELLKTSRNEFLRSQHGLLFKKRNLRARIFALKLFGRRIPQGASIPLNPSPMAYIGSVLACLNSYVSRNVVLRKLLKYAPLKALLVYLVIFEIIDKHHGSVYA